MPMINLEFLLQISTLLKLQSTQVGDPTLEFLIEQVWWDLRLRMYNKFPKEAGIAETAALGTQYCSVRLYATEIETVVLENWQLLRPNGNQ